MADLPCSHCQLFGKPLARINFIIIAGSPDSMVYQRVKHLIRDYSGINSPARDTNYTNYDSLMNISDQVFNRQTQEEVVDASKSLSTEKCCHGFEVFPIGINDVSDSAQLQIFKKDILNLLELKADEDVQTKDKIAEPASWIMMSGSNTLLVEENEELTDKKLQDLLEDLFRNQTSQYRAIHAGLRSNMSKLLQPRRRTVRDIRAVRGNLQKDYQRTASELLKLLLSNLRESRTAEDTVRRVVRLVLDECELMSVEEKRPYVRQLMCGVRSTDPKNSNTTTAQMIHYALRLLENYQNASVPLIYSITLTICRLSCHFIFRHELFNNTPEIYTLSMLLVTQRHYALTIGGLRLCSMILDADLNEHKYAIAYLKHDQLAARKILDAIKWLLSPYTHLKSLWKQKSKHEQDSELTTEDSPIEIAEGQCFRHAGILLERAYMRRLASLFYGAADHCLQVTEDDIHKIAETIDVLANPRMTRWFRPTSGSYLTKENTYDQEDIISQLQNVSPHGITVKQAEQCIREIYRRRTTFDDHDMRKSICGSLKHLGSDLYSSSVHFLHELIQNAEDNIYDCAIVPCLRIELNHDYILLSNNEQGLRATDVLAIFSLAVSTKTIEQKHIGEKGVGFKSVFAASDQPMLISHAWKFYFKVPGVDAMSYITPLWVENIPECISSQISTNSRSTHLYLPLKLQAHTPATNQFLNDVARAVDSCILLNMRQLKKLEIVDRREEKVIIIEKQVIGPTKLDIQPNVIFENCNFMNLTGSINQLCTLTGYNTFRVYACNIDVPSSIEQRRTPTTSLIMAFPCKKDYCLTRNVYTGLPVCDLGFNFMFNADFHLVTSRENVRENVQFNTYLRDNLAVLFVYLIQNDPDLRKDIGRYCPSSDTHQIKHSSWWLIMIDRINALITKYLSVLFDIKTGKLIRHVNSELTSLISNEQLYNCANIQVIDSSDGFLTQERLKSFQIQSVSIKDVLECFPNCDDPTNEFRHEFRLWTQKQDERWWAQFFHHLSKAMTPEISATMLLKPIFILQYDSKRQYLPRMNDTFLLLFINDDPSIRMWKRQITLLRCTSQYERNALLNSNRAQLLTEKRLIEIILHHHLQLARSSKIISVDTELINELWQDLFYLRSRLDKFDKSTPLLVPINRTLSITLIQNTILPTLFGVDIRSFIPSVTSPFIHHPYYDIHESHLINHLQWEYFFLEMNCHRPSIQLPKDYTVDQLPLLPSFTMLTDEKWTRLSESILLAQTQTTQECLRQFPIVSESNTEQQISPISATFDKTMVTDLPSLPQIIVPSYCRSLASKFGVCAETFTIKRPPPI
ncbi:unnamed protein product [Rotaria sordida]|uniref:Uncharacterized protein n=1 Tax=Rotaria sordida TaxID=392033 RepID=A0A815J8A2_9BILA|nr:unnamed protein product [Rotaria sordida]CAF1613261.1 unnamed protein product [Rotaria sordida]